MMPRGGVRAVVPWACALVALLAVCVAAQDADCNATPVLFADNGHYYQVVHLGSGSTVTWAEAKVLAEGSMHNGWPGYLATLTLQGEKALVNSLECQGIAWIGASDSTVFNADEGGNCVEGDWLWVSGPETGRQFYRDIDTACLSLNADNDPPALCQWDDDEPNNSDGSASPAQNYAVLRKDSGQVWNDIKASNAQEYYIVEFSDPAAETPLTAAEACGNGVVDCYFGEECDLGGGPTTRTGCTAACRCDVSSGVFTKYYPAEAGRCRGCGNGFRDAGEECELDHAGCQNNCLCDEANGYVPDLSDTSALSCVDGVVWTLTVPDGMDAVQEPPIADASVAKAVSVFTTNFDLLNNYRCIFTDIHSGATVHESLPRTVHSGTKVLDCETPVFDGGESAYTTVLTVENVSDPAEIVVYRGVAGGDRFDFSRAPFDGLTVIGNTARVDTVDYPSVDVPGLTMMINADPYGTPGTDLFGADGDRTIQLEPAVGDILSAPFSVYGDVQFHVTAWDQDGVQWSGNTPTGEPVELTFCGLPEAVQLTALNVYYEYAANQWVPTYDYCQLNSPGDQNRRWTEEGCLRVHVCHLSRYALGEPVGSGFGDPHFDGFYGGSFDFHGEPDKVFNLFSSADMQVNARFIEYAGVEGTYMGEIGVMVGAHNRVLFHGSGEVEMQPYHRVDAHTVRMEGGVTVHSRNRTLTIVYDHYVLNITRYRMKEGEHEPFLGLKMDFDRERILDVDAHGVLGQTARHQREVVGRGMQGEGVVEGVYTDYVVREGHVFGVAFRYNRFEHTQGGAGLTGIRRVELEE